MKKGSFYWGKSIPSWHWGPRRSSPVLGSQVFSFDINTEHKTYHGVGVVLAFPYCYFRIQYTETTHTLCMSKWTWVGMCEGFLTRIFCVCSCPILRGDGWILGDDWCSLQIPWDSIVKPLDSTSKLVTQDVPTGFNVEEGLGGKLILLLPHMMQTQWRDNWPSSETKTGTNLHVYKWSLTIQTKFSFTVRSTFDGTLVVPNTNLTTVLLNTTRRTQSQQDVLRMGTQGQQCALMVSKEYFKE
jgi:hypothetical protein